MDSAAAASSRMPGSSENSVSPAAIRVRTSLIATHLYRTRPHFVPRLSTIPLTSAVMLTGSRR